MRPHSLACFPTGAGAICRCRRTPTCRPSGIGRVCSASSNGRCHLGWTRYWAHPSRVYAGASSAMRTGCIFITTILREAMRRASRCPTMIRDDGAKSSGPRRSGSTIVPSLTIWRASMRRKVTVAWVQTLELAMPVHRFAVQVRRRKADRVIRLDWNPQARALEPPACEFTASTECPRLVCDDALHLVVPAALSPCATCGRQFCRACHRERCPKCGATVQIRARAPSASRS